MESARRPRPEVAEFLRSVGEELDRARAYLAQTRAAAAYRAATQEVGADEVPEAGPRRLGPPPPPRVADGGGGGPEHASCADGDGSCADGDGSSSEAADASEARPTAAPLSDAPLVLLRPEGCAVCPACAAAPRLLRLGGGRGDVVAAAAPPSASTQPSPRTPPSPASSGSGSGTEGPPASAGTDRSAEARPRPRPHRRRADAGLDALREYLLVRTAGACAARPPPAAGAPGGAGAADQLRAISARVAEMQAELAAFLRRGRSPARGARWWPPPLEGGGEAVGAAAADAGAAAPTPSAALERLKRRRESTVRGGGGGGGGGGGLAGDSWQA